jgi:uncharacterized membrane protein YraQ (UPF0718 family)
MKQQPPKKHYGLYFPGAVALVYLGLAWWDVGLFVNALHVSWKMALKIAPVMLVVLFFMILMSYFVKPQMVKKHFGKGTGVKAYLLAVTGGVLSHGPIFIWYPFLKNLKEQGMRSGLMAVFLYARAVKLPLLPLMVAYFGFDYTLLLTFFILLAAFCEGVMIDRCSNC